MQITKLGVNMTKKSLVSQQMYRTEKKYEFFIINMITVRII